MEKFLNIMYDFFAFALPGACIIASVSLLHIDGDFLYNEIIQSKTLMENIGYLLIALAIFGYIVGYIIKPIARYILLLKFSIFLYAPFLLTDDAPEKMKRKTLAEALENKDKANDFIKIKELTPNSFKYIEFWDMHTSMAHNLAFASLVFLFFQIINLFTSNVFSNGWYFIILISTTLLAFFILLRIALKFAYWWYSDIDAAIEYIKDRGLMEKDKKN